MIRKFILLISVALILLSCAQKEADKNTSALSMIRDSVTLSSITEEQAGLEYNVDHFDAALALYDSAIALNPRNAQAWQGRGATLALMLRHDQAQVAFDKTLELKPDYLQARWHRACDNAAAGRVEEALSDLRKLIAVDSSAKSWPAQDTCWNRLSGDPELAKLTH